MTDHPMRQFLKGAFADALPRLAEIGRAHHLKDETCLSLLLEAQKVAGERANGIEKEFNWTPNALVVLATLLLSHLEGTSQEALDTLLKRSRWYVENALRSQADGSPPPMNRIATDGACLEVAIEYLTTQSPYSGGAEPPAN